MVDDATSKKLAKALSFELATLQSVFMRSVENAGLGFSGSSALSEDFGVWFNEQEENLIAAIDKTPFAAMRSTTDPLAVAALIFENLSRCGIVGDTIALSAVLTKNGFWTKYYENRKKTEAEIKDYTEEPLTKPGRGRPRKQEGALVRKFGISVPEEDAESMDAARGAESRSDWITDAIRRKLKSLKL